MSAYAAVPMPLDVAPTPNPSAGPFNPPASSMNMIPGSTPGQSVGGGGSVSIGLATRLQRVGCPPHVIQAFA
eukprot:3915823-Prorocentrum_lima.AAC.1